MNLLGKYPGVVHADLCNGLLEIYDDAGVRTW